MHENFGKAFDLGKGIGDFAGKDPSKRELKDGVDLAGNVIDLTTNIVDSTPLGEIIKKPMALLDEHGMARLERTKIAQNVKEKFSSKISRVVAQKMHASSMVKASTADSVGYLLNVHSDQEFMDQSKADFDRHQANRGHKIRRKLHDKFRVAKKNPVKILMIPLGLIPDGGITKKVVSGLQYLGNKGLETRKARKKKGYAAGNMAVLEQQMGTREAQRKIAKWKAKDIAELGPKLQRNLYKLKQSVALLESREAQMNAQYARAQAVPGGPEAAAALAQLSRCNMDLAMSFHESKHYIEKITSMCEVMEETAFETRAHMVFLDELLVQTELAIRANADALYK
ncbi:hypothetical protein EDI28_08560 [Photobacterium chitinilyticum]|uniref:Uncharacterized protein n=2 Tax=Photobacterium chitinilyticum TaxID=2485123 RepID=A0A444JTK7_9GAMM|nr:hypothetical protein EDI28_08560 [Photobacterium chitinilyticum]